MFVNLQGFICRRLKAAGGLICVKGMALSTVQVCLTAEAVALAATVGVCMLFSGPLRGFAAFAAAKLVIRQGTRALPRAAALVTLPAFFGCLLASEAARIVVAVAVSKKAQRVVVNSARALAMLGDPDRAIADLASRALHSTSSPTSVWRPCIPRGAAARASVTVMTACAARRYLLAAALMSALAPFFFSGAAMLFSRAVLAWWVLSAPSSPSGKENLRRLGQSTKAMYPTQQAKTAPSSVATASACVWDAFGTYSCAAKKPSTQSRSAFPAAVLEGFDASPAAKGLRSSGSPTGFEGFCGCSASHSE